MGTVLAVVAVGFVLSLLDADLWLNGYLSGMVAIILGTYLHDKITLKV